MPNYCVSRSGCIRKRKGRPEGRPCSVPSVDPQSDEEYRSCTGATAGGDDSGVRIAPGVVASNSPSELRKVAERYGPHHPPDVVFAPLKPN